MPHSHHLRLDRRSVLRAGAIAGLAFATSAASRRALAQGAPLKIGIIGSGHIGSTVGSLWVKSGHPVMFSSRHPEELTSGAEAQRISTVWGTSKFVSFPFSLFREINSPR